MAEEQVVQEQKSAPAPFPLKAILGQKVGMTLIFTEGGQQVPVSVIYTGTCLTTELKTKARDGYEAVQLGLGEVKEKSVNKPDMARFQKNNVQPRRWLKEFRVPDSSKFQIGQKVTLDMFTVGDYVDVAGISKGKGFAGVMKRHGFSGLPASHGASDKERSPGSSGGGSGQPQRVLKGTRMAGRMGSAWITTQNLEIIKLDKENDLLLVKGAVPGVSEQIVIIQETTKPLKHKRPPMAAAKSAKKTANVKKVEKPGAKK